MKTLFIAILIAFTLNAIARGNKHSVVKMNMHYNYYSQDTLTPYLNALNLNQFISKPVDSFFALIPANYLSMQILPGDQMKRASALVIRYPNGIKLGIFVKDFTHMNPNPPSSSWSIPLFRKENVYRIEIFNGTTCINGCD